MRLGVCGIHRLSVEEIEEPRPREHYMLEPASSDFPQGWSFPGWFR